MAEKFVFTQQKISDLAAPKKRTYFRDIREPNLGLSVTPAGTKSFFVAVTINRSGNRVMLGKFPALSVPVARQKTRETLVKISRGINPVTEKKRSRALSVTLRTVLDSYVEVKNLKPATVSNYRRAVDEAFTDYLDKPLSKITETVFRKKYLERGRRSPARAELARRVVRAVFNFAKTSYKLPDGTSCFPINPTGIIAEQGLAYKTPRRNRIIAPDQMAVWWKAVQSLKNEPPRDLLAFLLFTGTRISEPLNLNWQDVDLRRKTFILRNTKNGTTVELPLPEIVATALRKRKQKTGRVFPITPPKEAIRRIRQRTNIEFSAHDLRRVFATTGHRLDINFYSVKRLLNHTIPRSDAMGHYDVPDLDRLRAASRKIETELLRQMGVLNADVTYISR
jgi:integrase